MRPSCRSVCAPSSTLLKLLRTQSENVYFFTQNTQAYRYISNTAPKQIRPHNTSPRGYASRRCLSTSPRPQAALEASVLNLDFLRPAWKTEPSRPRRDVASAHHLQNCLGGARHKSTNTWSLLRRLWGFQRRRPDDALKPRDLPPLPGFLTDDVETTLARSIAGKASNELKLRCTEWDENGNCTLVNGEFKKAELIAKVHCSIYAHYPHSLCGRTDSNVVTSMASCLAIFERLTPPSYHTFSCDPPQFSSIFSICAS